MRTLQLYLFRQVVAVLLMTVGVFTFVLLLFNVLKEILALLVNRQASFFLVLQAIGLLVPFVLAFALPMGLLTATLLVFGRFSADNELTAARASGVSLVSLITPILLLSVALSGLAALINAQVAPLCRIGYKQLLVQMGTARVGSLLPEKTFIKDFPGHIIYVGQVDGTRLRDIYVYQLDPETKVEGYLRAAEGELFINRTNRTVTARLHEGWRVGDVDGKRQPIYFAETEIADIPVGQDQGLKLRLNDMTLLQLFEELRDLEQRTGLTQALAKTAPAEQQDKRRALEQQVQDLTVPAKIQIHRMAAFSFACLGFTLVGIPLGIRAHRRETSFNIAVALVLVLVYYSFFILGQSLEGRPEWAPHLILWLPNFIFQAAGAVLLWRANRGF